MVKFSGTSMGSDEDHHYTILDEERVRELQNIDISKVSTHLSVSRGVACTLLLRNNWSTNSVFDQWFADEEAVSESLGLLLPEQESLKPDNYKCKICFEKTETKNLLSCPCGHPFCPDFWRHYLSASINSGPACLSLRCPEPECKANVGPELVDSLSSEEDKEKYYKYLVRSYVEARRNMKWCPGPGCDRAVQIDDSRTNYYEVTCDCSYEFCWNCLEERHHPVDCETVAKWTKKNSSEVENNDAWIRAFTKPCPKCHRNIEKNQGCKRMACPRPCGYQFCWFCLGHWDKHWDNTAHSCKEEDSENLEATKENLKRYALCYEKWAWNHKSRETALDNLRQAKNKYTSPFVIEALEQIVESRRVLKWSFAYVYYLPLTQKKKIVHLRCLQEDAEAAVERLRHIVGTEIEKYTNNNFHSEYLNFRPLFVTKIEKLVRALENDVSEAGTTRRTSFSWDVGRTASWMFMLLGSYCILRVSEFV